MNAFIIISILAGGYNNFMRNGKNIYIPYNGAYSGGGPAPYSPPFPRYTYKYKSNTYYYLDAVRPKKSKKPKKPKNKDNI